MKKRIFAFAIALCLSFSLLPTAAQATEETIDVGPADLYYAITGNSDKIRMYDRDGPKEDNYRYGYIDDHGLWVLPPQYKLTSKFYDSGYAAVTLTNGKGYIINTEGDLLLCVGENEVYDIQGDIVIFGNDKGQGAVSLKGKLIAPVRSNGECVFVLDGKYVIQTAWDDPYAFNAQPKAWIYDASGRDLFPDLQCTDIKVLSSDRLSVATGSMNRYGVAQTMIADFNGKRYPLPEFYQTKFVTVEPYAYKDMAAVSFWQLRWGGVEARYLFYINKQGKMVTPEIKAGWNTAVLSNGYYYATLLGSDWRKYDTKGKELGPAPGDMKAIYANGTVVQGSGADKGKIFTIGGKQIPTPEGYEQLSEMYGEDTSGNICYRDMKFKKMGLMDKNGKVLIPMAKGYIARVGNYYKQYDQETLNYAPKFYDLNGNLIAEIPTSTSNGRFPMISGGRTVYAPLEKVSKPTMAPPAKVVTVTAAPSHTKLTVDGKAAQANAYLIGGNNYIKLRDLAALLSGTGKQFEVTYDAGKGAVNILTGKPYTTVGGELAPGDGGAKSATTGTSPLYIDGKGARLKAYAIGGNNFYKLRDVMQAINVSVGWDAASASASLDTAKNYVSDTLDIGVYSMRSTLEPAKYVDVSQGSTKAGAQIITWAKSYDPNQSFVLEKVGGKYRIIAVHSGMALSTDGTKPNTQLVQQPISNDPNQLFTLVRQPSGGYNIIAATGQYVCVAAGSTDNGTAIIVWDKTGSKGQEFLFQ